MPVSGKECHVDTIKALKGTYVVQQRTRRLTSALPEDLRQLLEEMGADLSAARRSRHFSQAGLADEMCVSRRLVSRMEKGDPTVSFGAYAMAAWIMKLDGSLSEIFSPQKDKVFQEKARSALEKRVRNKKSDRDDHYG